jgi:hypothetical protein
MLRSPTKCLKQKTTGPSKSQEKFNQGEKSSEHGGIVVSGKMAYYLHSLKFGGFDASEHLYVTFES